MGVPEAHISDGRTTHDSHFEDLTYVDFPDARHYLEPEFGQTEASDVETLMDVVVPWITERFEVEAGKNWLAVN